ncbi:MAG TPA: PqqD family peptide modification chaperone [Candidatus Deferrimicrobiaceae bacterium]|nr:PqqD family peptide modification chaperone [Candidatus Deferrimicrobiaceae bacterium]
MRPKRNPEIVWRLEEGMRELAWERARAGEEYEDLGVLTLMDKGAIHQLNLVGAEVWTRINGINTGGKIARDVAALFENDAKEMEEEVGEFLRTLEEKGWVILDAPQAPQGPLWKTS